MLLALFINTPLQRGAGTGREELNRFSGFHGSRCAECGSETAKAVNHLVACIITPLKQGINERAL